VAAKTAAEIDVGRLSFHILGAAALLETVLRNRIFGRRKERWLPREKRPIARIPKEVRI
jgi:hypothetical protein